MTAPLDSARETFLDSILGSELDVLEKDGLYRRLRTLEPLTSEKARLQGREITLFCGNDYLGLSHHPRVVKAFQAAAVHGTGSGAARLISGTSSYHTQLEEKIAQFKGCERALVFSTGYQANVGVLSALVSEGDLIVMDKLCHASLIDGARLSGASIRVFPHRNYARLEEILKQPRKDRRTLIVSDTVFSMDGDLADLDELGKLRDRYGALLAVDDAHGTGVLGPGGRGHCRGSVTGARPDILLGTLSKAVGCLGGFAAGSRVLIETLINRARTFIFATSLPPALCAAAAESFQVLEEEPSLRERLHRNIQIMGEGLKKAGLDAILSGTPIFPVILGEEKRALEFSARLLEAGYLVPAIRYPTVGRGKARLRVTVSAGHDEPAILDFLDKLKFIKNQT